jgi:transcriptional regulator with XRE-family HTH domain
MKQIDPKKIVAARKARGLDKEEVALLAGLTPTAYANYESGYSRPQPHALAALCDALRVKNPLDLYSVVEHPEAFSPRKKHQLGAKSFNLVER